MQCFATSMPRLSELKHFSASKSALIPPYIHNSKEQLCAITVRLHDVTEVWHFVSLLVAWFGLLYDSKDGSNRFLRRVGKLRIYDITSIKILLFIKLVSLLFCMNVELYHIL